MKKIHLLLVFFMLFTASLSAQYTTDWIRPADNIYKTGSMIARDSSDNVFVTGYIQSQNIYTRKYNKFGALQWEKTSSSGIASNYEKPVWTSIDKNNNAIVVGYRYALSSGRDYPNAIVVLKYNPSGFLLWKKVIPVSVVLRRFGSGLNVRSEVDNAGNIYISTVTANISGFALYKLNSSGVLVFTKNSAANAPNGFNAMRLKGSRIAVTGASGTISNAPVAVWDTAGNLLFTKAVLGQGGSDVEIDAAGNVYLLTSYSNQVTASSGQDISIYKFNSTGVQQWKRSYDFGGSDFSTRFVLAADKLSVIGSINVTDWITFQVNNNGTQLWNARYNTTSLNPELPADIAAKGNGEVFVTGKGGPDVRSVTGSSFLRMVTIKYSNTGTVKWIDSVNTSGFGISCVLAKDSSLFALSHANMTAYHFIDQTATGTCGIPTGIFATNVSTVSTTMIWSPVAGATLYHLRYKTATATTWTVISTSLTSNFLSGLSAGTTYNYAVEAVCASGPSGYSATQSFTTFGTGYCSSAGQSQALEYLSFVWMGGIMNSTGNNNGYGDFTNLSTPLTQGQTVTGYLSGRVRYPEVENYGIWIDFNHNNSFTDPGEQVVNLTTDFTGWIGFSFVVPTGIAGGPTRMRVVMSYGAPASPCGNYAFGETEDYTVDVNTVFSTLRPKAASVLVSEKTAVGVYPNPAADVLYVKGLAGNDPGRYIEIYDMTGRKILVNNNPGNSVNISTLRSGTYLIRVIQNKTGVYTGQFIKK
ncbi:MAG: T9SS type A sorting domain-containing protein [Chitinophagaceae bacterium]|nr:T9SS type A sorting domain-containing protein [Chitinophagaceae bacterium]